MRRAGDTGGQLAHPDPDVLAEFRGGLISGRRRARIGAHLAACDGCAALNEELAGVSALLAAVPAPAMPESVAQRLDMALATEVANRDHSERAGRGSARKRESWPRPAWTRDLRLVGLRVLAPVAAVVLLAAGGYELSDHGRAPAEQGASSAAGQAPKTAASAAAPVAGPLSSGSGAQAQRMSPAGFPLVVSPTVFRAATFKQQVEAALRPRPTAGTTASAAVRACVQAVTHGLRPVLVESARFGTQPATVIVVRTGQGHTAWAAGSRCSAGHRDLLAEATVP